MKKIWLAIQFFPLTIFVLYARIEGIAPGTWAVAFKLGAILALIETTFLIYKRVQLNRLILGVNLFLLVGGTAFQFQITPMLTFYGKMMESSLFAAVIVVGIFTTFLTPAGFIEVQNGEKKKIVIHSLFLLVVAIGCLTVSMIFRGNIWLAGTLPFVCLVASRKLLQKNLTTEIPAKIYG